MGDRMFSKREAAGLWFYVWGLRVLAFYIPVMTWFNHPEDRDMAGLVIGAAACVACYSLLSGLPAELDDATRPIDGATLTSPLPIS